MVDRQGHLGGVSDEWKVEDRQTISLEKAGGWMGNGWTPEKLNEYAWAKPLGDEGKKFFKMKRTVPEGERIYRNIRQITRASVYSVHSSRSTPTDTLSSKILKCRMNVTALG
jgi:hypothetical protein